MEGGRKKRRNPRLQMDLNLWFYDFKDMLLSFCFYEPYLFISDPETFQSLHFKLEICSPG